jgi:hypothetical protein
MDNEKPSAHTPEELTLTHDGYFRETFQTQRIATAILRKALPTETIASIDLDGLTVEERSLGDDMFKDSAADVIYKVPIKKTAGHVNFFTVIEHKSYQDLLTIFQLWGYVFRICLRELRAAEKRGEVDADYRLPPVVAIIIHHGDTRFQGVTELAELFYPLPGLEQYLPRLRVILFDLSAIADDDPILNDPEVPELKVVLMVLKTIFRYDGEVALTLSDVLCALKPYSDDPETRRIIRATWFYLANNARYLRENPEALSGIFREVITGENEMRTIAEVLEARGEARGEAKAGRNMVLAILEDRFGEIPQEMVDTVNSYSDQIALKSLAVRAASSKTLDEFKEGL